MTGKIEGCVEETGIRLPRWGDPAREILRGGARPAEGSWFANRNRQPPRSTSHRIWRRGGGLLLLFHLNQLTANVSASFRAGVCR